MKLSFKAKLFTVWVFFVTNIRRLFRDKTALFFTFLFPLIFLFVFGGISGRSGTSFNVAIISDSSSQYYKDFEEAAKQDKVLKLATDVSTLEQAQQKMSRGQLDSTIYFPSDFGVEVSGQPNGTAKCKLYMHQYGRCAACTNAAVNSHTTGNRSVCHCPCQPSTSRLIPAPHRTSL